MTPSPSVSALLAVSEPKAEGRLLLSCPSPSNLLSSQNLFAVLKHEQPLTAWKDISSCFEMLINTTVHSKPHPMLQQSLGGLCGPWFIPEEALPPLEQSDLEGKRRVCLPFSAGPPACAKGVTECAPVCIWSKYFLQCC